MEPGDNEPQPNGGVPTPSAGVVLMALLVAALVVVMVGFGGGVNKPLTTHAPTVAATQATRTTHAQG